MIENIQPPTDNLYKFLAIGGLVFALVALVVLLREQAAQRERWTDAQVELLAAGYKDGSGEPTDPDLRRAYFRREFAMGQASEVMKLAGGVVGKTFGVCLIASFAGFGLWWWKVQRHDDAILRATAAKLLREERAKSAT